MILGMTPRSIDISVGSGLARMDHRLEMADEPVVYVATPGRRSALARGAVVDIVTDASSRVRAVVVEPAGAPAIPAGRHPWDAFGAGARVASGRLTAVWPHELVLAAAATTVRANIDPHVPIVVLRRGSRADLLTQRRAVIDVRRDGGAAEDVLRSAIVGAVEAFAPPL